jgi:hypothetical protein
MTVEETDPVTLAEECGQCHQQKKKLNLPCRHAITSFSR